MLTPRGIRCANIARKHGMQYTLKTASEANRAGLTYSLAFALCEQETGTCRNVFGHDPTIFVGAGEVTKAKYLAYKAARGHTRMQGVGPLQLTWWETQDRADRLGGCWRVSINLRVGFQTLAALVKSLGLVKGCERYNGSGPRAVAYSASLRSKERKWHARFN